LCVLTFNISDIKREYKYEYSLSSNDAESNSYTKF